MRELTGEDEMALRQALNPQGRSRALALSGGREFCVIQTPHGRTCLLDISTMKTLAKWPNGTPLHQMLAQACEAIETGKTYPEEFAA